tara:strand:- start:85 stop:315 length:231 start_codon:yes stop_codon:yes gene_type:complete
MPAKRCLHTGAVPFSGSTPTERFAVILPESMEDLLAKVVEANVLPPYVLDQMKHMLSESGHDMSQLQDPLFTKDAS